ncbi:MAG: biotin transport system substrate-specific component [Actinomycetota bacterium]|nr:biotin transport system substrate-specific component [Actinomycetota bacterium]
MTALAQAVGARTTRAHSLIWDIVLVVSGTAFVALLAQISIPLEPFSPVPITGQTLGVLVVGGALGAIRGGSSLILYLALGSLGAPIYAGGDSGSFTTLPTGGFLIGFIAAAVVVGYLAEKGWDRSFKSSLGAMLIGEIVVFAIGVPWLAANLDISATKAMEIGLYPFVIGDVIKLLLAAGLLPTAWKLVGKKPDGPSFKR